MSGNLEDTDEEWEVIDNEFVEEDYVSGEDLVVISETLDVGQITWLEALEKLGYRTRYLDRTKNLILSDNSEWVVNCSYIVVIRVVNRKNLIGNRRIDTVAKKPAAKVLTEKGEQGDIISLEQKKKILRMNKNMRRTQTKSALR